MLSNLRKHTLERGGDPTAVFADPYAAGPAEHVPAHMRLRPSPPVLPPRTWLLPEGWLRAPS